MSYTFVFEDCLTFDEYKTMCITAFPNYFGNDLNADFITLSWSWLFNQYQNSSILFDTKEAFKRCFENQLYVSLYNAFNQYTAIKLLYNVNFEDELSVVNKRIANNALNNNQLTTTPFEVIKFVSNQVSEILDSNKVKAYTDFINTFNVSYSAKYINSFKWLFRKIIEGEYYYESTN